MPSLMSMEDLFYGPPEATWILPTRDEMPRPRYREREFSPSRQFQNPEPLRPVERYHPRPAPGAHDLRPVVRARGPPVDELRPVERLARVHTPGEPVPVNAGREEIRKVVEVPVPVAVAPPTQVVTTPASAPPPPVQVVKPRSVSPPRAILHHPIELKVPMCCEKCAKKVKERLLEMEGVDNVVTDQYNQKVIVHGRVEPSRVLNRVKLVKKRSAFWDMTVDYSENYRRARQAEDAAEAREVSKAAAVKAEAVADAKAMAAPVMATPAMVTPAPAPKVVVNLPQEQNGPKVTAILPAEKENAVPYVANSRVHNQRYMSPPKGFRQEFFHGPREEMRMPERRPEFYNGRYSQPAYAGY